MQMLFGEQYIDGVCRKIKLSQPEIFIDHEKNGRSGHCGHALAEFEQGKIIAFYSNNQVIKFPDGRERMLVLYSENYNDPTPGVWSGQVNVMHLWIESC